MLLRLTDHEAESRRAKVAERGPLPHFLEGASAIKQEVPGPDHIRNYLYRRPESSICWYLDL